MNKLIKVFMGGLIFCFIFISTSFSIPVNSNSEIGKALDLTEAQLEKALSEIDKALDVVSKNEEKKKRKISFLDPVKVFDLCDKYSMIAYKSKYESGEDAIVGFLVIKNDEGIEIHSSVPHLIWRGSANINSFK